jgi:hypothetical protein
LTEFAGAQAVSTFAGNAQHTAVYKPAAQDLNQIRWSTPVDLNNNGDFAHYGAPLITSSNTVVAPVKTNGTDGAAKYSLLTDYILPAHSWIPVYQPVLTTGSQGGRLYYPFKRRQRFGIALVLARIGQSPDAVNSNYHSANA